MTSPAVTVVIPTHNSARFIRSAVDSVLDQKYRDFETIVVDDASTDETVRILESYGDRIRLILRQRNSHTADIPRYEGVEQAKGTYCAFLDSDDRWTPDKLAEQVAFMESNPDMPLSHTYVMMMDVHMTPLYIRHEGVIPPTGWCARALFKHCFISTSSVMVRREHWLNAQRKKDLKSFGTEWDFFLSIARSAPVGFIPEPLSWYRKREDSISRSWKRCPRDVGAKTRIYAKQLWKGVLPRQEMIDIILDACEENGIYWRDRRRPLRAAYFAVRALRYAPMKGALYGALLKAALVSLR